MQKNKYGGSRICPRGFIFHLNVYLFLVYIDNTYGLHLKEQIQILSQNWKWLEFCSHSFIPKRVMSGWGMDIGRKFYGRKHDLVDRYGKYVSQTLTGPFLVHDLSTYTR
jgi:hypothetical protein